MIKNTETVFEITADEKRLNISIEIAELVSLFKLSPVNFGAELRVV